MRFDFDEDQHEIKRTARELLDKRSTFAAVRKAAEAGEYDPALWTEMTELGWPGIAIAEEHGGAGLGMVELAILCEEAGYALAGAPLLATASAAAVIAAAGSDAQQAEWLPKLASGEAKGALAGADGLAPDGAGADVIVVVDGDQASLVTGGEPVETVDPTRRYARVDTSGGDALPGDPAAGVDRALVAVSAELLGLAQRALEMTVAYVKDRKQFGVPVGSFQAVSHRCAGMLLAAESARSVTYYAAWAADAAPEKLFEAARLAKATASDSGVTSTADAIQAHGGIGFTWEADVHWLYKRAQLDAAFLGGASAHRRSLGRMLADRTVTALERVPTPTGSGD